MQFNASDWKNEDLVYGDPPVRAAMLDDLMTNQLRTGMSQADVEALLGPPTDTEKFAEHDLVYWVGEEQGFIALDSRWLVLDFDDDGGLANTSVVSD